MAVWEEVEPVPASRAGHWKHDWVPLDPVAAKEHFHGHVPAGWKPGKDSGGGGHGGGGKAHTSFDTDAIAAKVAKLDARYRSSAAIHHVTGIDSPGEGGGKYSSMVNLANDLKKGRLDPEDTAKFHAENFSAETVLGQADRAEAIAQVLDKTSHEDEDVRKWMPEHPAETAKEAAGLHAYARAAREAVAAKNGGRLPEVGAPGKVTQRDLTSIRKRTGLDLAPPDAYRFPPDAKAAYAEALGHLAAGRDTEAIAAMDQLVAHARAGKDRHGITAAESIRDQVRKAVAPEPAAKPAEFKTVGKTFTVPEKPKPDWQRQMEEQAAKTVAAGEANARGMDRMYARGKAQKAYMAEATGGMVFPHPGDLGGHPGDNGAWKASDLFHQGKIAEAADALDRQAAGETNKARAAKNRKLAAQLRALTVKPTLPVLAKVQNTTRPDGSFTALDQNGTEYTLKLAGGTITVSSAKGTLQESRAEPLRNPTRTARVLADRIAKGEAQNPAPGSASERELREAEQAVIQGKMLTPRQRKILQQANDRLTAQGSKQAKASRALAHEKLGHTDQGLWHHRGMQLPAYIQHIAKDLHEERGMPLSVAIATAISQCERWARGGEDVKPETRAKAAAAIAEWNALKAKAKVTRSGPMSDFDSDGLDGSWDGDHSDLPDLTGLGVPEFDAADGGEGVSRAAKLGTGARFKALSASLGAKGATNPDALAAWIGRKRYGKAKFASLASKARKGGAASRGELFRYYPLEDIRILSRADGDSSGRVVEAYATVFDTEAEIRDGQGHYREVIDRTAFDEVLSRISRSRGGFAAAVKVLYNHGKTMEGQPAPEYQLPLGVPLDIRPETRGLLTRTEYDAADPFTERVLSKIRSGAITSQSFVGGIIRSSPELRGPGDRYRGRGGVLPLVRRMALGLREYGPVLFPAYSGAEILGVRMSLPGDSYEEPDYDPDGEYGPEEDEAVTGGTPEEVHPTRDHAHRLFAIRTQERFREAGMEPRKGEWA